MEAAPTIQPDLVRHRPSPKLDIGRETLDVTELTRYLDHLLLAALPFVAMVLFLLGTIYRYRVQSFTYSSLSSQFLENRRHFWGMVPFHYGILTVLAGHVVALFSCPAACWLGTPSPCACTSWRPPPSPSAS